MNKTIIRCCPIFVGALFMVPSIVMVAPSQAEGQTVFLPSFRNFTYRGSVSVPDGGTVLMGSVNSSNEQANSSGVPGLGNIPGIGRGFRNRGIGREQQAGNLTAKATIIDMKEIEADHLAKAGYGPGGINNINAQNAEIQRKAAFLSKHVGRNSESSRNDR